MTLVLMLLRKVCGTAVVAEDFAQGPPEPSPATPASLDRAAMRRTIALVVDDLGLSFDSMCEGRRSLGQEGLRHEMLTLGTLGALRHVVDRLQGMPGRKSVILFSDGFSLFVHSSTRTTSPGASAAYLTIRPVTT